jgi:hypothetical protein
VEAQLLMLKCVLCGKGFNANNAKFTAPIAEGIVFSAGFPVQCLLRDGTIRKKQDPQPSSGDRIVTCPYCDSVHTTDY